VGATERLELLVSAGHVEHPWVRTLPIILLLDYSRTNSQTLKDIYKYMYII